MGRNGEMDRRSIARRFVEGKCQKEKVVLTMVASGTSMGPTLTDGTRVRVRFDEHPELRRNQIICFRRAGRLVIHRLVGCFGLWCIEKGDGNRYARLCRKRDIVGVLVDVPEQEDAEQ